MAPNTPPSTAEDFSADPFRELISPEIRELRFSARLAATQALYQMDIAATGTADVLAEFESWWIGQEVEGVPFLPVDTALFHDLVQGLVREQRTVDRLINGSLTPGWPLTRILPVLRAILRAGVCEMLVRPDIPPRVTIDEFVEVSRRFYDDDDPGPGNAAPPIIAPETGLVNAVLDAVARELRPEEMNKNESKHPTHFRK
ncbi:MAG: transcription antitermination factor NusB [Methylobacteriaceae bacterium]|jgi:N utilization substance protein B|nr:transcription antitermination factor NusB [Methylobacteriaceae bacterium]